MPYCTNCGRKIEDGYDFCPECGAKIVTEMKSPTASMDNEEMKICPKCGEKMPKDAFYCFNCGWTFDEPEDFSSIQTTIKHQFGTWKNKWIALLFCIFLGWMGAHKYYEGEIGRGILYTLTFGIFGVGWIVDIIILAFKPNPYLAKR